jgi:hypothetical protein
MLFNSRSFFPQIRQMFFRLSDFLFFGYKSRSQIRGIIASAETDILMTPSLQSSLIAGVTAHSFTSSHMIIYEYSHILIL